MNQSRMPKWMALGVVLAVVCLAGCSGTDIEGDESKYCMPGEDYNPVTGECQITRVDVNPRDSSNVDTPGANERSGTSEPFPPEPSNDEFAVDGDGPEPIDSEAGDDYVDEPNDHSEEDDTQVDSGDDHVDEPQQPADEEGFVCPFDDEDSISCTLYAHTPTHLYRVNPFQQTITQVMEVPTNLFDIDTHPDGTLYGITTTTLYRFRLGDTGWSVVGNFSQIGNANGLCIDSMGKAYISASQNLYTVNLATAATSLIGTTGQTSSGDCVVTKGDVLYMSASGYASGGDRLVRLNGQDASATVIGAIGFSQVYALTAAWGYLFGLTGNGELISIDTLSGQGELIETFSGHTWYGAASTPGR